MKATHLFLLVAAALCAGSLAQNPAPPVLADQGLAVIEQPLLERLAQRRPTITRAADGCLRAAASTYEARFAGAKATFRGAAHGQSPPPELSLRLTAVARGASRLQLPSAVTPDHHGERIDYVRPGVVERYDVGPSSMEQSFLFAARPEGSGDLCLEITIGGNVQAPGAEPAHQPLSFADGEGANIHYGAAYAIDAAGERLELTTAYDGVATITLTVPHDFVELARYPLVVDPVIGSGIPVPSRFIAIAYDDANQRYGAVDDGTLHVLDRNAVSIGTPRTLSFSVHDIATVHVPGLGSWFVLVGRAPDGSSLRYQVIRTDNGVASAPRSIVTAERVRQAYVGGGRVGIAMLFWKEVAADGRTVLQAASLDLTVGALLPALSGLRFVDSFPDAPFASFRAEAVTKSDVVVTVGAQPWSDYRVAYSKWFSTPAPGDHDIYVATLRTRPGSGVVLHAIGPADSTIGADEQYPSLGVVASRHVDAPDTRVLLAWMRGPSVSVSMASTSFSEIRGRVYDNAGPVTPVTILRTGGVRNFSVASGQTDFFLAWNSMSGWIRRLEASRVSSAGVVSTPHQINAGVLSDLRPPAVSSRLAGAPSVTESNRTLIVYDGNFSSVPTAYFFDAIGPTVTLDGTGCPGPWGSAPKIEPIGIPHLCNGAFRVGLRSAAPGSFAVLLISTPGFAPIAGAPGCSYHVVVPAAASTGAMVDASGTASVSIPIPCHLPAGTEVSYQWLVSTPGWNPLGRVASTAMHIRWDH